MSMVILSRPTSYLRNDGPNGEKLPDLNLKYEPPNNDSNESDSERTVTNSGRTETVDLSVPVYTLWTASSSLGKSGEKTYFESINLQHNLPRLEVLKRLNDLHTENTEGRVQIKLGSFEPTNPTKKYTNMPPNSGFTKLSPAQAIKFVEGHRSFGAFDDSEVNSKKSGVDSARFSKMSLLSSTD
jgi:hypothetical protein